MILEGPNSDTKSLCVCRIVLLSETVFLCKKREQKKRETEGYKIILVGLGIIYRYH